jgi:hypothetical protein
MKIISQTIVLSFCMLLICSQVNAQRQSSDPESLMNELSIQQGVIGSLKLNGQSAFTGYNTNLEYAHFTGDHWGYRTGVSFTNALPGCGGLFTIPLRVAYRTNTYQTVDGFLNFSTMDEFIGSLFSLVPSHVEFNGGLSLGYARSEPKPALADYYKVNNPIVLSIDMGIRFNLHIGRINLFAAPQFSYIPTQNFVSYSNNGTRKEYEPSFFGGISAGIGWRY